MQEEAPHVSPLSLRFPGCSRLHSSSPFKKALSQPFSQQHSGVGSTDLHLYFQMRKPRLRRVR